MTQTSILAAAAARALSPASVFAGTIYSTTGTGTDIYGVGSSPANGHQSREFGDQITLPVF